MTERPRFATLSADAAGNVLPIAAAGVLVAAAIVGGGVDASRGYRAQNRLQAACDSAVLAGRRAVGTNGFDSVAEGKANAFFATNFDPDAYNARNVEFEARSDDNGNVVTGEATATVDTALMNIFGFQQFEFDVTCSASMGVGNSDIVLVLDTTGSMDWDVRGRSTSTESNKRIYALREAMKNFYITLQGATSGSNARIRYGFVPYSSSVNVGNLLMAENPAFIADSWTIQSRRPIYVEWGSSNTSATTSRNESGSSCPDTSWTTISTTIDSTSNPPTSVERQSRRTGSCTKSGSNWNPTYSYKIEYRDITKRGTYSESGRGDFVRWDYKPITYDVSTYKTGSSTSTLTGERNGAPRSVSSTWKGCIEERATSATASFSFSVLGGMSPYTWDLDLDTPPDPSTAGSLWGPMWPEVAYRRNASSSASSYCPVEARLLSEMDQTSFNSYANSLRAAGSTYLDIGMLWGGRLLSPDGIFQDTVNEDPANGGEVSRHIIFMTDGTMDPSNNIQSTYGIEELDRRVTSDGSDAQQTSRHTSRFLAICGAIRAKGIRVWVIAFTTGLNDDLLACASDESSYLAADAEELDEAFQEIAKQVGELRIIQ